MYANCDMLKFNDKVKMIIETKCDFNEQVLYKK